MILEWLKEVWNYKELFYFFAWRDIKLRYRQTYFGVLWAIMQPLITMVVFTVLFGKFVRIPSDGIPYPVFYISAILPWNYFVNVINQSGNSLITDARLLTKVYFPRVILPASSILTALVDFTIGSFILAGLLIYYKITLSWRMIFIPLIMIPMMLLTLGLGMFLAALNVKYRDVKYAIPFFIQLMFFLTPIIYPSTAIPPDKRWFLFLNPVAGIIDGIRSACLPGREIDVTSIGISMFIVIVILAFGLLYFIKAEKEFSDIV